MRLAVHAEGICSLNGGGAYICHTSHTVQTLLMCFVGYQGADSHRLATHSTVRRTRLPGARGKPHERDTTQSKQYIVTSSPDLIPSENDSPMC